MELAQLPSCCHISYIYPRDDRNVFMNWLMFNRFKDSLANSPKKWMMPKTRFGQQICDLYLLNMSKPSLWLIAIANLFQITNENMDYNPNLLMGNIVTFSSVWLENVIVATNNLNYLDTIIIFLLHWN